MLRCPSSDWCLGLCCLSIVVAMGNDNRLGADDNDDDDDECEDGDDIMLDKPAALAATILRSAGPAPSPSIKTAGYKPCVVTAGAHWAT